ncbi:MAG: polysaccharide deacetylase family protein [Alphaproteobacteria bacterium]
MRSHLFIDLPLLGAAHALAPSLGGGAYAAAAAAIAGVNAFAAWHPRGQLYFDVWWRLPADAGGVALTFDDGPHPEVTPRVLDLLAARDMQATFFVVGQNARRHPALLRRMAAEGHAIGLHSDTHDYRYALWSRARVTRDIEKCRAAVVDAVGVAPTMFRPPLGLRNPLIGGAANAFGLATVLWTAGGRDRGRGVRAAARIARRATPGAIVLLHDGTAPGDEACGITGLHVVEPLLAALDAKALKSRALNYADGILSLAPPIADRPGRIAA